MVLTPEGRPNFTPQQIQAFAIDRYGITGVVKALPGEWDQNFLLDAGEMGKFVLKIANRGHETAVLEFQDAARCKPEKTANCHGDKLTALTLKWK